MLQTKYLNSRPFGFRQEYFRSFSLYISCKQAPWSPCFSTDQNYLNNLARGLPKEHLYEIIFKSKQEDF